MCKILLFGGTTEGREMADFFVKNKISATVCVTTEYGAELIEKSEVMVGKLDFDEIKNLLKKNDFLMVIDATHPYAMLATQNIKSACEAENVRYFRILRDEEQMTDSLYFDTIQQVVDYLNCHSGNALITTGSKELSAFCSVINFSKRITARVLFTDNVIEKCLKLGFTQGKIIAEKGPFTLEQNLEHLKKSNAKFLVTKESGSIGGFDEKVRAARMFGAELLIIKRPKESGFSLSEIQSIIKAVIDK